MVFVSSVIVVVLRSVSMAIVVMVVALPVV
jgi:hypothetical protein